MNYSKLKDSLNIIQSSSSNISRYLKNGGSNQVVIYQELDSIDYEISELLKIIKEIEKEKGN